MTRLGQLPSIENLQCFLAAAEQLNFRRAAKEVALTPTAFSGRIRAIEEQLGSALFTRTTRSIELTGAGRALVPVAREAVRLARRCVEVVHEDAEPPAAFRLGTRFELGLSWLAPALVALERAQPTWSIDLYFGTGPDIIEQVRAGKVDCIVTSAPVLDSDWVSEFLHPETYAFVGAPDVIEEQPLLSPADAGEHLLLDIDESLPLGRYLISAVPELSFDSVRVCGTGGAVHQFALAGLGVAVLPNYMIQADLEAGRLLRLLPELELLSDSFRLLFRRKSPLAGTLGRLAEFLRAQPLR